LFSLLPTGILSGRVDKAKKKEKKGARPTLKKAINAGMNVVAFAMQSLYS
jgi:hypothetical protein